MKAVVLAAGKGTRLMPLTKNLPKHLLSLNGKTILEHLLDRLILCGIRDIIMVVGFKQEKIKQKIGLAHGGAKIRYVTNKEYATTNTLYSVWVAKDYVFGEEFIIMNGDNLYNYKILKKMVALKHRTNAAVDDTKDKYPEESNGFELKDGIITKISKEIPSQYSCGIAIGIYMLSAGASKTYFNEMKSLLSGNCKEYKPDFVKSQYYQFVFNRTAESLEMRPVSTDGLAWLEIDDHEDYKLAKDMIKKIEEEEMQ